MELALDPGLPQTLADAAQLQQVVLNLIVNAEQAIVVARGEESRNGRILIRTRRLAGDRVAMEVSDDGPGIPPEIVPRIFDPFFTTKPPGVGTGLGLSIVYGIVQEHGGEVTVDSLPGRGTTLTVELPALSVSGFDLCQVTNRPSRHDSPPRFRSRPRGADIGEKAHFDCGGRTHRRGTDRGRDGRGRPQRRHAAGQPGSPRQARGEELFPGDLRFEDAVRGWAGTLSRAGAAGEPDATQSPVCHGRHDERRARLNF